MFLKYFGMIKVPWLWHKILWIIREESPLIFVTISLRMLLRKVLLIFPIYLLLKMMLMFPQKLLEELSLKDLCWNLFLHVTETLSSDVCCYVCFWIDISCFGLCLEFGLELRRGVLSNYHVDNFLCCMRAMLKSHMRTCMCSARFISVLLIESMVWINFGTSFWILISTSSCRTLQQCYMLFDPWEDLWMMWRVYGWSGAQWCWCTYYSFELGNPALEVINQIYLLDWSRIYPSMINNDLGVVILPADTSGLVILNWIFLWCFVLFFFPQTVVRELPYG